MFKKSFLVQKIALITAMSLLIQGCANLDWGIGKNHRIDYYDQILETKYESLSGFIPFEETGRTSLGLLPNNMKVADLFLGADYMVDKDRICGYWNHGLVEVNPIDNPYYVINNIYFTCKDKGPIFDFLKVKDKDGNYVIPGPPKYIKGFNY